MLNAQLAHIREAGTLQRIRVGPLEVGALLLQKPYGKVDAVLLLGGESVPPSTELVGELNVPRHVEIMDWSAYFVKGAVWVRGLPGLKIETWGTEHIDRTGSKSCQDGHVIVRR
jgi:hypothetical protein